MFRSGFFVAAVVIAINCQFKNRFFSACLCEIFFLCSFAILLYISLPLSLYVCVYSYHNKNVRTTASIYLFVCREYFMSIPCIWLWLVLNRKCRICHMIWNRFEHSALLCSCLGLLCACACAFIISFFLFWNVCAFLLLRRCLVG